MSVKRALLVVLAVALLAGCGDDSSGETTTSAAESTSVRVYFLRDGKVWPVAREVDASESVPDAALDALRLGPTEEEKALGLTTEVPEDDSSDLSDAARAQLVYTMSQSAPDDTVEVLGKSYTRSDFEERTPLVLVESPLPFEEITTPVTATGTANTFEATFQYELVDSEGNVVDENFVTATSGTGTRGTFEFTTKAADDVAALRVFVLSAEDGSRTNEVEIPLTASQ